MLRRFLAKMSDEKGQGLVEYALILVLISIVCIAALTLIGVRVDNVFDQIAAALIPSGGGGS